MSKRNILFILSHYSKMRFIQNIIAGFIGAVIGIILIFPVNEAIYYYEHLKHQTNAPTLNVFIINEYVILFGGKIPEIAIFYIIFGAILGLTFFTVFRYFQRKTIHIRQLIKELERDINLLISQGENSTIEFKSSLRWDLKQEKINRSLEEVVLKTIAGFLNGDGGTLLIGVTDDKQIVGLENDYKTLKNKNRDGFHQAITTLISSNFGTDLCQNIQVFFHSVDNSDICRVIVAHSNRPAYLKHNGRLKLFARTGVSTRELNVKETVEFVSTQWKND